LTATDARPIQRLLRKPRRAAHRERRRDQENPSASSRANIIPTSPRTKRKSEEKFKEINEAYEVLGDPEKRKKYDELGANWKSGAEFRPPPGYGGNFPAARAFAADAAVNARNLNFGGTGFSDFFEQIFGGARRGAGGFGRGGNLTSRNWPSAGATSKATSWSRSKKPRAARCARSASGTARPHRNASGQNSRRRHRRPAAAPAGRGEHGSGGGAAGDLYLRVRLAKHPDFDVEDHNLIYEAELAPWEAALGAEISVPTLTGRVNIKIPPERKAARNSACADAACRQPAI
jgi:curved DNA-binding protein